MQKANISTAYRKDLRVKIPEVALALFQKYGVRAVKMDDIASHLQISKRTLYEIYGNKEDLLLDCIKIFEEANLQDVLGYAQEHNDVMRIMMHFYRKKISQLGTINPLFFTELHRYGKVEDYFIQKSVEQKNHTVAFFKRGVEEGYFLPNLNYDIVTRLGDASMNYVMTNKMYEQYSLQEIFSNFVSVLLRGYCTEKGQKILEECL